MPLLVWLLPSTSIDSGQLLKDFYMLEFKVYFFKFLGDICVLWFPHNNCIVLFKVSL